MTDKKPNKTYNEFMNSPSVQPNYFDPLYEILESKYDELNKFQPIGSNVKIVPDKDVVEKPDWVDHWKGMPDFMNEAGEPFDSVEDETDEDENTKRPNLHLRWMDDNQTLPRYPVYIISKGRAAYMKTSRTFARMKVPHYIAVEPQDMEPYNEALIKFELSDYATLLELPFSNHGEGPGKARNWCWDHSIKIGAKRHWVLDDNISDFYRLHNNVRVRVDSGSIFRAAEDFVDRYKNAAIAGFQYRFFISPKSGYPPYSTNTRIFSTLLIENTCPVRWEGTYNEDVDLSLRLLKSENGYTGYCTIQFNIFLQGKEGTQNSKGGNTDEFYWEGTYKKSTYLYERHPDVSRVVFRYNRWHHVADFSSFKHHLLQLKEGVEVPDEINNYGMKFISDWKIPVKSPAVERMKQRDLGRQGLIFTTRAIKGREGKNVIPHMTIAKSVVDSVDVLSHQKSNGGINFIRENGTISPGFNVSPYADFYENSAKHMDSWADVYDALEIDHLADYEQLIIVGGVDLRRSNLERNGKRVGIFPRDKGQLKFQSTAKVLLHLLAMLKAHREHGIPLHEITHDPNEMSLDLVHPDFVPKENYHLYFGYDIPRYGMKRIDSMQYHLEQGASPDFSDKPYDLTFGYTVLKESGRTHLKEYVDDLASGFQTTKIFTKNDFTGEDTLQDRDVYMDYISKSKYTIILPAYDSSTFSIFRLIESLHRDCLPLIHPDCNLLEINQSFDADLSLLVRTEPFANREEVLRHFKEKITTFKKGFIT